MSDDPVITVVAQVLPGVVLEPTRSLDGHSTMFAEAADLPALAPVLRDAPETRFAYLAELTAVDYWPREPRFEVVYILVSFEHGRRLRLKVRLTGASPRVGTVSGVWPAANWLEREVWDMFGIEFTGHPDLRRLLMPDDWQGHPLRKDYPVQIRQAVRASEPLELTPEEFRANLEQDRRARQS